MHVMASVPALLTPAWLLQGACKGHVLHMHAYDAISDLEASILWLLYQLWILYSGRAHAFNLCTCYVDPSMCPVLTQRAFKGSVLQRHAYDVREPACPWSMHIPTSVPAMLTSATDPNQAGSMIWMSAPAMLTPPWVLYSGSMLSKWTLASAVTSNSSLITTAYRNVNFWKCFQYMNLHVGWSVGQLVGRSVYK